MRYYIAVVHKDEASAFGLHFPDVPGCFSACDSMDDMIGNGAEALSLFAEHAALPEPRSIEQIRSDADVRVDLAEGAFLVAVPLIENDTKVQRVNVTMERGMLKAIDAAAKARNLTRSAFLAQAARREIEN